MEHEERLYNMLFPLWFAMLMPQLWAIVIPGNFIIDSAVLLIAAAALKIEGKWKFYQSHILWVWLYGFVADGIGQAFLFLTSFVLEWGGNYGDSPLVTVPAVAISAYFIWLFNRKFVFRNRDAAEAEWLSLILAIATAPYSFLVPSRLLYSIFPA